MHSAPLHKSRRKNLALRWACGVVASMAILFLAAREWAHAGAAPYFVIVHASNPVGSIERAFVARSFLKTVKTWPQGQAIEPVDLDIGSETRRRFSDGVLGRSVGAVRNYWLQLIFSGRDVPPPELKTNDEIVKFVAGSPGAIGYVSPNVDLRGVKVLSLK